MNFDKVTPGGDEEMLPESVADMPRAPVVKTHPIAHSRSLPICADNPAALDPARAQQDFSATNPGHPRPPEKFHPCRCGSLDENPVQGGSSDTHSQPLGECTLHGCSRFDETDSAEGHRLSGIECHAEVFERRDGVGHQTFATGLINGRLGGIRDYDVETLLTESNSCGQTCRSATHNESISFQ